ncbi:MAG: VanZ family protein [Ruminococcus sp.]|nr:VanZ family protein [Ruminococcus sp.]
MIDNRQRITLVLFITYCLFIIYYTLLCREVGYEHAADLRLMWAYREMFSGHPEWKEDVLQNILNIVFFIPYGLFFPKSLLFHINLFRSKPWQGILLSGILFSLFVELTQYMFCLGLCELDDVICNGLGAVIGYGLFRCFLLCLLKYKDLKGMKDKSDMKELDE